MLLGLIVVLIVADMLLQVLMFWRMRRLQQRYDLLSAEYDLLADNYELLVGYGAMMFDDESRVSKPPSRVH